MSQENVEIARRFFAAVKRSFETYWQNPRSFAAALEAEELWPEAREVFKFVHPDAEWQTIFWLRPSEVTWRWREPGMTT
jgi:hypothetical protein